jgi:hypothetical protein
MTFLLAAHITLVGTWLMNASTPYVDPIYIGAHCDGFHDDTNDLQNSAKVAQLLGTAMIMPNNCWIHTIEVPK